MSPSRSIFVAPSLPAGHLRVGRERREMPGQPGAGRGRGPIIARPGGRFHPVGCFRPTLFVRRQRDHPGDEIEHGKSPGAPWGVWAKPSSTLPRTLCVLGKPPCTEMALSWATVRASSRSGAHWWLVAKTRIRHMIDGPCRSIPLRRTRSSFNVTASDTTGGMVL